MVKKFGYLRKLLIKAFVIVGSAFLVLMMSCPVHAETIKIFNKDYRIEYRIETDNCSHVLGCRIWDKDWRVVGYIKDGKIYDKNFYPKSSFTRNP